MTPEKANWTGLTHIVHFSANPVQTAPYLDVLVTAADSLKMENNGADVGQVNRLISNAHAHGVKVLLSLGGIYGTGATNMNYICSDSARTDVFATASAAYALRRGYDGIEVDWEPPSSAVASARLYRLIRRELNNWPVRGLLAIAVANNDSYSPFTKFYDTQELLNDVDQCNVMMYDMHLTPSYAGTAYDVTAYNAPLNPPGPAYPIIDQYSWNYDPGKGHTANAGVRLWNAEGMPYSKMAAGIPFYGYLYKGKTAPNQTRGSVWPQYISYKDIMFALSHGGTYHWDSTARVPWISGTATAPISWYATTGDQFYITFDDTNSIKEKVNWAKRMGLGGIMIYELYMGWNDTAAVRDPLLRAVNSVLGRTVPGNDSIPPTIGLSAPVNGDSITIGTTVRVSASAADNVGVTSVSFLLNGNVVSSTSLIPFTWSWSTTGLTGAQTLSARAYDASGNSTTSAPVTVYMKQGVVIPPPPGTELAVYSDVLFSPWNDASWSATNTFNSTEVKFSGTYSIKSVDAAWGGLQFWASGTPINADQLATLDFTIYTTTPNLVLNIFLRDDAGQSGFPTILKNGIQTNQWVSVSTPVSTLNPSVQPFTYVAIQNYTGSAATFYIDNIHFNRSTENVTPPVNTPKVFSLGQNYPNPFNPETMIRYEIAATGHVTLKIYNVLGEEVASLVDGNRVAGTYSVRWNAGNLGSGVYVCVMTAGGNSWSRKMILMR